MFYDSFVNLPALPNEYLPYDRHEVPSGTAQGTRWFIFHAMAEDFVEELKNEINGFATDLAKLHAWSKVHDQCPEECKDDFSIEILGPAALTVLNRPYVVKQRLAYVGTMLLHQTKMLIDPNWKESELDEHSININTFDKFRDTFTDVQDLLQNIREIDNPEFRKSTGNFRNLYQHRIPPGIEIGLSPFINRQREGDGSTSYGFGGQPPLRISEILPLMYDQHRLCLTSFHAFWGLMEELLAEWTRERPID